jgi:hypothetical protein
MRKLLDFAWMIPTTVAVLLVAAAVGGLLGGLGAPALVGADGRTVAIEAMQ